MLSKNENYWVDIEPKELRLKTKPNCIVKKPTLGLLVKIIKTIFLTFYDIPRTMAVPNIYLFIIYNIIILFNI